MTVTKKDIVELSMAVRWMEEPLNEARRRTVGALLKRMQAHVEEIVEHGMVEDGLSPTEARRLELEYYKLEEEYGELEKNFNVLKRKAAMQ